MLVHIVCNELGGLLVDLTPSNLINSFNSGWKLILSRKTKRCSLFFFSLQVEGLKILFAMLKRVRQMSIKSHLTFAVDFVFIADHLFDSSRWNSLCKKTRYRRKNGRTATFSSVDSKILEKTSTGRKNFFRWTFRSAVSSATSTVFSTFSTRYFVSTTELRIEKK